MTPTVSVRGLYRGLARRALDRAWRGRTGVGGRFEALREAKRWGLLALECPRSLRIPVGSVAQLPHEEIEA